MTNRPRRIGILAGGGTLPLEFARSAAARGELAHIVALDGAADADFSAYPTTRIGMGQVGRMLRTFRSAGATDIVIIGPAVRPDLKRLKFDLGFFTNMPALLKILASGGDDGVLRGVVRFFEAKGFNVQGPADVAPETLAPLGTLSRVQLEPSDERDIALGLELIRALGVLDVGQAVVVTNGHIEAIEGAEGTDRMLIRTAERRGLSEKAARRGVLVKRPKPGQELRVDMPSIGPGTAVRATAAGLRGIAVHAGAVLVAERAEVIRSADEAGLFVAGVDDANGEPQSMPDTRFSLMRLGRGSPSDKDRSDMAIAIQVMSVLEPRACGGAVAVSRGHVLSVEAGGEGIETAIERVVSLRERRGRTHKRSGVAVVKGTDAINQSLVGLVSRAGLAGLVAASAGDTPLNPEAIAAADSADIFLASFAVRI